MGTRPRRRGARRHPGLGDDRGLGCPVPATQL